MARKNINSETCPLFFNTDWSLSSKLTQVYKVSRQKAKVVHMQQANKANKIAWLQVWLCSVVALIARVIWCLENVRGFETTSKYLISILIQMANTEKAKNKSKLMLRVQAPWDEFQLFSYCSFMLLWNTPAYEEHGPPGFLLPGRCCKFLRRCLICHNLKENTATNVQNTGTKSPTAVKWQVPLLTSFITFSCCKFHVGHEPDPCTLAMHKVELPK